MKVVPTTCPHDFSEMDVACNADGLCPLCLADENKTLRAALDDIAQGRLPAITDAMLASKESMQTAIAEYSQKRASEALAQNQ